MTKDQKIIRAKAGLCRMRIISVGTLKAFWEQPAHKDAEQPLRTWVKVVKAARWAGPPAVKRMFGSADILRDGRVVFDSTSAATSTAWWPG